MDDTKKEMNYSFKLEVVDEDTGEVIYTNSAYSLESLEEQDHKMQSAIKQYEERLGAEAEMRAEEEREEVEDTFTSEKDAEISDPDRIKYPKQ